MGYVGAFFLWTFFLFGILEFFKKIIFEFYGRKKKEQDHGKILLVVQNQEQIIEPVLRTLHHYGIEVEVIDRKSMDHTEEIIKRLSLDLETIHYINGEYDNNSFPTAL